MTLSNIHTESGSFTNIDETLIPSDIFRGERGDKMLETFLLKTNWGKWALGIHMYDNLREEIHKYTGYVLEYIYIYIYLQKYPNSSCTLKI